MKSKDNNDGGSVFIAEVILREMNCKHWDM